MGIICSTDFLRLPQAQMSLTTSSPQTWYSPGGEQWRGQAGRHRTSSSLLIRRRFACVRRMQLRLAPKASGPSGMPNRQKSIRERSMPDFDANEDASASFSVRPMYLILPGYAREAAFVTSELEI
jgi:hypothetical protein